MLPSAWSQSALAALLISFIFSPIIIRYNEKITTLLLPKQFRQATTITRSAIIEAAKNLQEHVIICGYGRVDQNIAKFLEKIDFPFPYLGLDLDPQIIKNAKSAGEMVVYGDTTHPEILTTAKVAKAKAILISFGDIHPTLNTLDQIRIK